MSLPERFGRYLLVERIATGGMAEIFKAKLLGVMGFEKTVVIKRILPFWSERRDFVAMLVDEAKILVHLNHPNIVQVFELGCEEGTYYIAMEYVEGVDLRQMIKRAWSGQEKIPPEIALYVAGESLKGLHYAHERTLKDQGKLGIVHRDISPQNILLGFDGEVKVTDFGIAKALIQTHETQTGVLKGKFAYMSPEQANGEALDGRSDLFSCAIVLYEMLFHQRLFASAHDIHTLDKVRRAEVPWPAEIVSALPPAAVNALKTGLALQAADRFPTAQAFARALQDAGAAGKSDLEAYLAKSFQTEIRDRKRRDEEVQQHTESFLKRQTQVSPVSDEDTVSVAEGETEPAGRVAPPLRPKKRTWFWAAGLGLAAAAVLAWQGFRGSNRDPVPTAPLPTLAAVPVTVPAAGPTPAPSPEPKPLQVGSLRLKALPSQARIVAQYGDVKREGRGDLLLEQIPVGTRVQVRADLKDYELEAKGFELDPDRLDQSFTFQLRKRPPSFGTLVVNAAPWGKYRVSGIGSGETPHTYASVPEGSYRVVVTNSQGTKTVSGTAFVRGNRKTKCLAEFEGQGKMSCY